MIVTPRYIRETPKVGVKRLPKYQEQVKSDISSPIKSKRVRLSVKKERKGPFEYSQSYDEGTQRNELSRIESDWREPRNSDSYSQSVLEES